MRDSTFYQYMIIGAYKNILSHGSGVSRCRAYAALDSLNVNKKQIRSNGVYQFVNKTTFVPFPFDFANAPCHTQFISDRRQNLIRHFLNFIQVNTG